MYGRLQVDHFSLNHVAVHRALELKGQADFDTGG